MTAAGVEPGPSDRLLAWLSARGRASRSSVDRACRVIAERFDRGVRDDRSPIYRYVGPLVRIGHVEAVPRGLAVVPPTFCWTSRFDRGVLLGARDETLRSALGCRLSTSHPGFPWPTTWRIDGERAEVANLMGGLGVAVVDDPGMRLLAALPTLERAIAAWPDACPAPAPGRWEAVADPERWVWAPTGGLGVEDGLIRAVGGGGRGWMIFRGGSGRLLDTPERRAVAWWAELARLGRPWIAHHRPSGRLRLPASFLPPPALVERPLIWASGGPPGRDPGRRWSYEAIEPERAAEVARVLGLPMIEDAS
jgi:hypothetical protein